MLFYFFIVGFLIDHFCESFFFFFFFLRFERYPVNIFWNIDFGGWRLEVEKESILKSGHFVIKALRQVSSLSKQRLKAAKPL